VGELDGKVALVTGGASGIGAAAVRALAAAGARVVVAGLHEGGAKTVADSINQSGGEAIGIGFDTSDEAQVAGAVEKTVEAFGGVDILLNNAGITSVEFMMRDGMIHELDVDLWDQTMAVNVRGYMLCTKHALPSMLSRGGGVILNTASGAGLQAETTRSAYGTSKAAVIGFTRNVATQYGKMGIRCVAVVPGLVMTPTVAANMPPPMIEMMRRHHLTAQIPGPEDVANVMVFLASDRAAFVTGSAISVDGGFSIHGPSYADEMAMWAAASGAEGAALAEKVRGALAARGRTSLEEDDAALLEDVLAHDVVWRGAANSQGVARGKQEVISLWNALAKNGAGVEAGDVVYADGLHAVGVLELSADGNAPVRQANVFHAKDGKVTELWGLPADNAVLSAFANGSAVPEHPNTARFRAAEEARARNVFSADDLAAIAQFLRDDVQWISPWGPGPASRDEVVAQFKSFNEATGGTMQLDLNEVFADDTHAVSLVRLQADRPDRPGAHMDVKEANVFHLDSEGRTYEFWGVAENQAEINAFWS
jgi:NAD(P)-dependent dehydrogenase (short-subunit alcohol dehydrogenase family)/ketosteroid isomerase-like protein